ncbi:alpha/beta fold hydrolase [Skermania sp. ID1734]|uniref:PHA/PHB synthase family protein n=1 Tax=Skermania sp. ID1734 TaxID=2597516 RepID=UPI00117F0455|nr:alpha/beta fold hydrolase [Skermania sp. ID1734]TSE01589.1 alpha/beta fold hydrolase [Skermania sp. ID1734]
MAIDVEAAGEAIGGGIATALDPLEFREVARLLVRPGAVPREAARFAADLLTVALGVSDIDIPAKDPLYRDEAWRRHPLFRRLAQGHIAFTRALERATEDSEADWKAAERTRYVREIIGGALSPANLLFTNPTVWRRTIESGGRSLVRGALNAVHDFRHNNGMPQMVDSSPFRVGENLACSPGSVVHREEMFELLHYQPATPEVRSRPLVFIPPVVSRYYVLDLAPGRSMVEYVVAQGIETFMVVWRNPSLDPAQGHGAWGIEDYLDAQIRAYRIVSEITGSEDVNVVGVCSGGATTALTQAHLAAKESKLIHAATYLVTMLDARQPNMVTMLATEGAGSVLAERAQTREVIPARAISRNFALMRPRDLVFSYVVNNWLLGQTPPAFDVLAWNCDGTNVSATFARDINALLADGSIAEPGALEVLGTPVDLTAVKEDTFIVAGLTDHITTWRPCYQTTQLIGGKSEVVIVNSGHIQSLVNPVGSSRYMYWHGPGDTSDPDAWRAGAQKQQGSWWPAWSDWLIERSGRLKVAPTELGSAEYPVIAEAPGSYVHE